MLRGWRPTLVLSACGLVVAAMLFAGGSPGTALVELVVFGALAAANSPLVFPPSMSAAEARRRSAEDGRPVVYWRPGCQFCLRLRLRLGRDARRAYWVNVWTDPEASATVRAANGGNETVPTVVLRGQPYANPDPAWVRGQLGTAGRTA